MDDVDINRLNGLELRRKIAVVPQDAVMFRESLGFNIGFAKEPDFAKLQAALKTSPDRYRSKVCEGDWPKRSLYSAANRPM